MTLPDRTDSLAARVLEDARAAHAAIERCKDHAALCGVFCPCSRPAALLPLCLRALAQILAEAYDAAEPTVRAELVTLAVKAAAGLCPTLGSHGGAPSSALSEVCRMCRAIARTLRADVDEETGMLFLEDGRVADQALRQLAARVALLAERLSAEALPEVAARVSPPAPREPTAERERLVLARLRAAEGRTVSADALARELERAGLSQRGIRETVRRLKKRGWPIESSDSAAGGWKLPVSPASQAASQRKRHDGEGVSSVSARPRLLA